MSTFNAQGQLELARGTIIGCIGKKRSGKSVMALTIAQSWPHDVLALDVAGDDGPMGPDVVTITGPVDQLPTRWPEDMRPEPKKPMILRYVPDAGSSTYLADMDHMIGIAYAHSTEDNPVLILVHEMGVLAKVHQTPPATRRLLQHNRHRHVTLVYCMPRPKGVEVLVLSQADLLYIFETPNPDDCKHIAATIGWDPGDFTAGVHELGLHECLGFDANVLKPQGDEEDRRLLHYPALPPEVAAATMAWAKGSVTGSDRSNRPRAPQRQ